jgi:hypothetical protein
MKSTTLHIACCSRCNHYTLEGRRGGQCEQLGVPVQGRWKACPLAEPVFLTPLPELRELDLLPKPIEIRLPEKVVASREVSRLEQPVLLQASA